MLTDNERITLLDDAPLPHMIINADTTVRYVNPPFEDLTGFASWELIGKKAPYPWWREEAIKETYFPEVGKSADLVVFDKDPIRELARVEMVFIQGKRYSTEDSSQ